MTPARPLPARRSRLAARDRWFAFWLVLPAALAVIGVSVYPVGYAIWTSFHNTNPAIGSNQWVGLANYRTVFHKDEFRIALGNTFKFAAAATLLTILLGLGMALVLNQAFAGRGLVRSAILVPWAMSGTVVGVLWAWLYDGGYGTLNGVLFKLGLIHQYQPWLSDTRLPILGQASLYLVVVAHVWNSAPLAALFLLAALQAVPQNLYRAAEMDGASTWQRFRYVTLPWIRPMLLLVLVLSTINGIMAFDLIYFLTKGGPGLQTTVFSWLGYNTIFGFFQFGQGTAILLILTVISLALALLYFNLLNRPALGDAGNRAGEATVEDLAEDALRATRAAGRAPFAWIAGGAAFAPPVRRRFLPRPPRQWRRWAIYLPVAVIVLWSLAPVAWLVICSVSPFTDLLSKPPVFLPHVTLQNYRNVFTGRSTVSTESVPLVAKRVPHAFANSMVVASATTAICLVLGSLAGYAYARLGHVRLLGPTLIGMLLTRLIPSLAIMVPWFILFRRVGLANTKLGLIISYTSFCLPLVLWVMKTYFETVPRNLERAAAVDGCGRLQTLGRVVLPLAVPGLIAAGLFAFIAAWNEFLFALVLAETNNSMTITYVIAQIYGLVQYGPQNYGMLFAAGIMAIAPPVLLALVFQRYLVQGMTAGSVKG
jgi:multiple sugar transport system permease protein